MWRARPVFISSTFQDMQAERDHLRNYVFPELEERLRARRQHLEWVDLRVGVATGSLAEEQGRELQVLKVCLAEVRRCRPFLIVLLGDRYGWVPPPERIRAAAAEEGFSADVAERSVTDLEIEFGIFGDPEQQPRSVFYFRESLPYAEMPRATAPLYSEEHNADPAAPDRARRVAALKERIATVLPSRVRHYAAVWDRDRQRVTGLGQWGRMVLQDIWAELDAETAAAASEAEPSWQQAERNALDDFVEDRARDFVGRRQVLAQLTGLASSPTAPDAIWGSCIIGEAGSGKSALFGELYRQLRQTNVLVLAHAAGASVQAASLDSMLLRWIEELATALGTETGVLENADPDTVDATFASLLARMAQQRRVIVLLDALDQFETTTRSRYMTWLSRQWPENARFIATAIPGNASNALSERSGVGVLPLPLLDAGEARRIIEAVCARYHRAFEPEIYDALIAKTGRAGPAWGNPLWLVLAVEELNLLDADDFARAQRSYTGTPAQRLGALMLDTIAGLPADIPGLYDVMFERAEELFGVRLAQNFLGLIAVSRSGWRESDFRILLPRASGDAWEKLKFAELRRLFRSQLRQRGALAQWDFNHPQMRAAVHFRLAALGVSEQSPHTIIADHLLSCPTDDPLHVSETMVHLLASQDYARAAGYYGDSSLSEAEVQGATRVLADAIIVPTTGTQANAASRMYRLLDASHDYVCACVAEHFLFELGDAIEQSAPLDARIILLDCTKQTFERLLRVKPGNVDWQRDLSVACIKIGDVQVALGDLAGALQSYRDSHAVRERLAQCDPGNAQWQFALALSSERIGDILKAQGDLAGALKFYRARGDIISRLVQSDPGELGWQRDLSVACIKIGDVHRAQGDLVDALKSYRASLAFAERLAQSDPHNAVWQRDLAAAHEKVGNVQAAQGDLAGALKFYRDSLAIAQRLAQSNPGNAGWQHDLSVSHDRIGYALRAQGDLAGALKSYRDALAICERLTQSDPRNALWQRGLSVAYNNVGGVQVDQRDLAGAFKSYRDALAIREQLAQSNPGNAGLQRDLSESYAMLAFFDLCMHNTEEALGKLRKGRTIMTKLIAIAPGDAQWKKDLAWFNGEIARLSQSDEAKPAQRSIWSKLFGR